jgi:hypothetical protein
MSDEQKDLVPYGEPVVLAKPAEPKAKSGGGCAAPAVVVFALIAILILLLGVFSRSSSGPSSSSPAIGSGANPTSTAAAVALYAPGIPTPTTPPVFEIHQSSGVCHPGIYSGGHAVVMVTSLRMRQSPGFTGKDDTTDTVHYLDVGTRVNVRAGPETVDGLCWWQVEFQGQVGWSANHNREGELLLAPTE